MTNKQPRPDQLTIAIDMDNDIYFDSDGGFNPNPEITQRLRDLADSVARGYLDHLWSYDVPDKQAAFGPITSTDGNRTGSLSLTTEDYRNRVAAAAAAQAKGGE